MEFKNNEIKALTNTHYYVTNDQFKVGCGKQQTTKTQLGVMFTLHSSSDIGLQKADFDYEISITASIIVHAKDPLDVIFGDNYMGGVDCNDILSHKKVKEYISTLQKEESFEHEDTMISPIIFEEGYRSTTFPLMLDNDDIILPYLEKVIENAMPELMTLIGFRLDNCVNMIGNTGWDMLQMQRSGKDLILKRLNTVIKGV